MLARGPSSEQSYTFKIWVIGSIWILFLFPEFFVVLHGIQEFFRKCNRILGIAALLLVLGEPSINLVFTQDIMCDLNVIATEDEVAQESQRFFLHVINDVLQFLPVVFEHIECVSVSIHEEEIL